MLPSASAAGAPPLFHKAASFPFGAKLNTLVCCKFVFPYPISQPVYGRISQCDPQLVYTTLFSNINPGRLLYCFGSKVTVPLLLLSPLPASDASTGTGPPNSSAPVTRFNA